MAELTVIIPAYNAESYIFQCVRSILDQSFHNFKLIIINDGSCDKTKEIITKIIDARISVIDQPNKGVIAAMNAGLSLVDTTYVSRVDADDWLHPEKFEKQINYLNNHKDCVLVGTDALHASSDGTKVGWRVKMPKEHSEIIESLFSRKSAIIQPTFMARSSAIIDAGGYSNDAWPEDYDLYFRLLQQGKLANINQPLYFIRLHNRSLTGVGMLELQRGYARLIERYDHLNPNDPIKTLPITRLFDHYSVFFYRKGISFHLNGSLIRAILNLSFSVILSPSRAINYLKRKIGNSSP